MSVNGGDLFLPLIHHHTTSLTTVGQDILSGWLPQAYVELLNFLKQTCKFHSSDSHSVLTKSVSSILYFLAFKFESFQIGKITHSNHPNPEVRDNMGNLANSTQTSIHSAHVGCEDKLIPSQFDQLKSA